MNFVPDSTYQGLLIQAKALKRIVDLQENQLSLIRKDILDSKHLVHEIEQQRILIEELTNTILKYEERLEEIRRNDDNYFR